jgi:hypothetical protein
MECKKELKFDRCPRCGCESYLASVNQAQPSRTFCLTCGYCRTGHDRFGAELMNVSGDETFAGVIFLKYITGQADCYSILGIKQCEKSDMR